MITVAGVMLMNTSKGSILCGLLHHGAMGISLCTSKKLNVDMDTIYALIQP